MTRRRKIIIGILAVVLCGMLAVGFWPEKEKPEPVYKGKKLSEWVRVLFEANASPRPIATRNGAQEAIVAFGTNAIPFYLEWLDYKPGLLKRVQFHLVEMSNNWLPFKGPDDDTKLRRAWLAYRELGELGEKAELAIPRFLAYVTNSPNRSSRAYFLPRDPSFAIAGLVNIGPPAVPAYLSLMTNQDPVVRAFAIAAGRNLYGNTVVGAQIRKSLLDNDHQVRIVATNAMNTGMPLAK